MKRLTDRETAETVRANLNKLRAAGKETSIIDEMYVRLADYENEEERREQSYCNYDPDEWYE